MTTRINKSWREQRKGLVAMWGDRKEEYRSIWEACQRMGAVYGCKPDTARKEIKRAVANGVARYDRRWTWADTEG